MVVLVPGMGDDVQAIKAGIIEIADVFVINKSDLPGAEKLERELNNYLGLSHRPDGWTPKIVHTVATEGKGINEALEAAREYQAQSVGQISRGGNLESDGFAKCCGSGCSTGFRRKNFSRQDATSRRSGAIHIRYCNDWLKRL